MQQKRNNRAAPVDAGQHRASLPAAGGGPAQCIPLTDFKLGLTGDIDAINNAHNLAMVAATSRMQHEFNYGDDVLAKKALLQTIEGQPTAQAQPTEGSTARAAEMAARAVLLC